jgi:hypothetical protein
MNAQRKKLLALVKTHGDYPLNLAISALFWRSHDDGLTQSGIDEAAKGVFVSLKSNPKVSIDEDEARSLVDAVLVMLKYEKEEKDDDFHDVESDIDAAYAAGICRV